MAASANPRARLEHILFHIQGVADTIGGISFDTYTSVYHMELHRRACSADNLGSQSRLTLEVVSLEKRHQCTGHCRDKLLFASV